MHCFGDALFPFGFCNGILFDYTQSGQRTSMDFKFGQITAAQYYLQAHSGAMAANGSSIERKKVGEFANRLRFVLVCTTKD